MIKIAKRTLLLLLGIVLVATTTVQPTIALTTPQAVEKGGQAYEEIASCASIAPITNEAVQGNANQIANAKIIIGIAKTLNLGQEGARIGLITGLQESGLRILSNVNVPISEQYPNVQGSGGDHDSVGVMQQRVGSGWSTFGSGQSEDIVFQLMDPVYAAQAFFGTPEGAQLPAGLNNPGALQKGLLNKGINWRTMPPGDAAQAVQISAFPDAYANRIPAADALIEQLWDTTVAIPLAIPLEGMPQGVNGCLSGNAVQDILTTVKLYAWPNYCKSNKAVCPGYRNSKSGSGDGNAETATEPYRLATQAAIQKVRDGQPEYYGDMCGQSINGPDIGADCGAFVTRVMRDSKADVEYNKYQGNTAQQLQYLLDYSVGNREGNPERYIHLSPADPLQPGDVAVQNKGGLHHTYMYVGEIAGFNGAYASASQCGRTGMASGGDDNERNRYEWFRLIQGAPITPDGGTTNAGS